MSPFFLDLLGYLASKLHGFLQRAVRVLSDSHLSVSFWGVLLRLALFSCLKFRLVLAGMQEGTGSLYTDLVPGDLAHSFQEIRTYAHRWVF